MLWCLCCALRVRDETVRPPKPKPAKEDDLDFDDKEKVPFY